MTTHQLRPWLRQHWSRLRVQLLDGTYVPQPVRRVSIPKPSGGIRNLGIPTVVDRFIQQAFLQVMQPLVDPTFSEHNHGFRPGRSAHGAIREAVEYVRAGRTVVVDVDLAKFSDRVNHDVLMSRVGRHVSDRRALRLIRGYLTAGIMVNGVVISHTDGTPQGGPLSPLLANILLDEVDKELEARGHAFVRYADDLNVYVRSRRAGQRVMAGLRRLFSRLHLQVNEDKSAVADVKTRSFLGFTIEHGKRRTRARVSKASLARLKRRVREETRPTRGRSLDAVIASLRRYLLGWRAYYCAADMVGATVVIYRELLRRGIDSWLVTVVARHAGSYWRNSQGSALQFAFPLSFFDQRGLPRMAP